MNKTFLKYIFAFTLIGLSFYYLLFIISKDPKSISDLISNMPIPILIWAMTLSILGGISNTYVWFRINKNLAPKTEFNVSYFAWSVSRIFRYIPGKAAGFIVRQKLQNSSVKHGIKTSVNEILLTFMTISLLSTIYFLTNLQREYALHLLILSIIIYCSILFSKPTSIFFELALSKLKIKIEANRLFTPPKQLFIHSLNGLPALLLHGASFFLLVKYGLDSHSVDFLYSTVTFYFSGIIGQISLIAPAGLGVREASLTFFMVNQGFNPEIAFIAALGSRVILIASELINVFLSSLLRFYYSHD
tara:strand:+ start:5085 stop:5993 length:909 start_codon:yes stop_codon:yes gene_type:complete